MWFFFFFFNKESEFQNKYMCCIFLTSFNFISGSYLKLLLKIWMWVFVFWFIRIWTWLGFGHGIWNFIDLYPKILLENWKRVSFFDKFESRVFFRENLNVGLNVLFENFWISFGYDRFLLKLIFRFSYMPLLFF